MKTIQADLPDDVVALAQEAASRQNQTLDQFVANAITRQAASLQRALTIEERAARGNADAFRAILDKVPHAPPLRGDER
jgi:uncharacterized protein (DUF1778 family)